MGSAVLLSALTWWSLQEYHRGRLCRPATLLSLGGWLSCQLARRAWLQRMPLLLAPETCRAREGVSAAGQRLACPCKTSPQLLASWRLVSLCAGQSSHPDPPPRSPAAVISGGLTYVMFQRYQRTQKLMPAGMVAGIRCGRGACSCRALGEGRGNGMQGGGDAGGSCHFSKRGASLVGRGYVARQNSASACGKVPCLRQGSDGSREWASLCCVLARPARPALPRSGRPLPNAAR